MTFKPLTASSFFQAKAHLNKDYTTYSNGKQTNIEFINTITLNESKVREVVPEDSRLALMCPRFDPRSGDILF